MLQEVADLGFEYAELSHGIRVSLVPGIVKAVEQGVIKISSLHNFCPLPPSVNHASPNLYQPTAKDIRERHLWLKQTRKTIEFASQLGAKCVVLHGGSVNIFWDGVLNRMLRYRTGKTPLELHSDYYYHMLVEKSLAKIYKCSREPMERLIESLSWIIPFAKEHGVKLGIENRDGLKELPMDRDYRHIIETFQDTQTLFYWHDTGHSKIKEILGFNNQIAQLESMQGRTLGIHVKDARNDGTENLPIGEGELDWNLLSRYFTADQVITLEVAPDLSPKQISTSKERLDQLIHQRFQ